MANTHTRGVKSLYTLGEALGADANNKLNQNDVGKAVKMAAGNDQNYVLCTDGDDIEAIVSSVDPQTVNNGFAFGGVQTWGRAIAQVDAGQAGQLAVGGQVVSGGEIALNTAGVAQVKSGTGTIFKWRVVRILSGDGSAGDSVLIERC